MLELYLDTTDVAEVARFNAYLPIRGITTNPTILAKSGLSLKKLLPAMTDVMGIDARFHVQVVSESVVDMVAEARQIVTLPYDLVVKIPATEAGLTAIKQLKLINIPVLATAIYSAHQGFLAALCGADYLAPYVNRIETLGVDGVGVVADLQHLLARHGLQSKLLPASFKNTQQVVDVLKVGVAAITLPCDVMAQMVAHPAVAPAVKQFSQDWQAVFQDKLAFDA